MRVARAVLPAGLLALTGLACSGSGDQLDASMPVDGAVDMGTPVDMGVVDSGPDDQGTRDADPPDMAEPPDGGPPPDLGQILSGTCQTCDTGCPGGQCLTLNDGRTFCADDCAASLDGCVDGFSCVDIANGGGQYFCIPPAADCDLPGATHGTACFGGSEQCAGDLEHCEGDDIAAGYCSFFCNGRGSLCPPDHRCLEGDDGRAVCISQALAPAQECGRIEGEQQCAVDQHCPTGSVCLRTEATLPGVCALPCDQGCGADETCLATNKGDLCLSDRCSCHANPVPAGTNDLLGQALAQIGKTRCSAIYPSWDLVAWPGDSLRDPYRLSFFNKVHHEPFDAVPWGKQLIAEVDAEAQAGTSIAARAARMVEALATRLDRPAVRHPATPIDPGDPLVEAMTDLLNATGGSVDRNALVADAADVPLALQMAIAEVIEGVTRAHTARQAALASQRTRNDLYSYGAAFIAPRSDGFGLAVANAGVTRLLNETFDYGEIYGGSADLLEAISNADLARFAEVPTSSVATSTATFLFVQNTPIGRVAIGDGDSGIYDPRAPDMDGAWALLVDLGGNDTYRVPAGGNQDETNSVSVLLDLQGADRYGYVEVPHPLDGPRLPSDEGGRYTPSDTPDMDNGPSSFSESPRQGGGRVGVGLLLDYGNGDDEYRSLRLSQGTGVFGVGALLDEGGDDVYLAEAASQGASAFGIGLLLDDDGDDVRRAYTMAQGFAYARGAGLVYDVAGDDQYLMDPGDPTVGGDPLYFSGQRAGRANTSLGQGFGFGRRADQTDRGFMSGGIGILRDLAGADRYEASIFAQGGGFWMGTGILADASGNDTYDALWYAMGTGAHFALGLFFEGAGNDFYGSVLPRINVTIGGAHDYSVVFLIDEEGDDSYFASRISLGAGNVNGFGVFVDNAGNDTYRPRNVYALGNAFLGENNQPGSARLKVDSIGIFLDAGGTDDYMLEANMGMLMAPADNASWVQSNSTDPAVAMSELGSGIDGVGETSLHVD